MFKAKPALPTDLLSADRYYIVQLLLRENQRRKAYTGGGGVLTQQQTTVLRPLYSLSYSDLQPNAEEAGFAHTVVFNIQQPRISAAT